MEWRHTLVACFEDLIFISHKFQHKWLQAMKMKLKLKLIKLIQNTKYNFKRQYFGANGPLSSLDKGAVCTEILSLEIVFVSCFISFNFNFIACNHLCWNLWEMKLKSSGDWGAKKLGLTYFTMHVQTMWLSCARARHFYHSGCLSFNTLFKIMHSRRPYKYVKRCNCPSPAHLALWCYRGKW